MEEERLLTRNFRKKRAEPIETESARLMLPDEVTDEGVELSLALPIEDTRLAWAHVR